MAAGGRFPPYAEPRGDLTAPGDRFRHELEVWTERIKTAQPIARAIVSTRQAENRMAGGRFFALADEFESFETELDQMADDLLAKKDQVKERAKRAVEDKHSSLDRAAEFLDRVEGVVNKMGPAGDKPNGGPTVGGSADLPAPSPQPDGSSV